MKSPNLSQVLDQFSAPQQHSALLFVRRLNNLNSLAPSGFLGELDVKGFIDSGMNLPQVEEATMVLKAVCDAMAPAPNPGAGVADMGFGHPKIIDRNGLKVSGLLGVMFVGSSELEKELHKREVASSKQKVVLQAKRGASSVCVIVGEKVKCYATKGASPMRFKIITILLKTESGKSARTIADKLAKDGANKTVQDNLKKEIRKVNELFKEHCEVPENLILQTRSKGKNVYSLNRDRFVFEVEK